MQPRGHAGVDRLTPLSVAPSPGAARADARIEELQPVQRRQLPQVAREHARALVADAVPRQAQHAQDRQMERPEGAKAGDGQPSAMREIEHLQLRGVRPAPQRTQRRVGRGVVEVRAGEAQPPASRQVISRRQQLA